MTSFDVAIESAAEGVGRQATAMVTTAPFAFAAAGLAIWLLDVGPVAGWRQLADGLAGGDTGQVVALLVIGSVALSATGAVVAQVAPRTITLLEGYWPGRPAPLARFAARRRAKAWADVVAARANLARLAAVPDDPEASGEEHHDYVAADRRRRAAPSREQWIMPTRLGNLLRAAETRPYDKYGIDPVKVWPAFWLVLPDTARAELARARATLDAGLVGLVWCALGLGFTPIAWWAAPLALLATAAAHRWWVIPATKVYADLLEAAFDVHRFALYDNLHLPLPAHAAEETTTGPALTEFLWRGSDEPSTSFTTASSTTADARPTAARCEGNHPPATEHRQPQASPHQ